MGALLLTSCNNAEPEQGETKGFFNVAQHHYGNWSPAEYISKGWTGYHIISNVVKQKIYGESSHNGDSEDEATYWNPNCHGGDCPHSEDISIFEVKLGKKTQLVGTVKFEDLGSKDKLELVNNAGKNIIIIDEENTSGTYHFDELQGQTFKVIDKNTGSPIRRGTVEESDATNSIIQPEIIFDEDDNFKVSVIEKIGAWANNGGKEWFRHGTYWCHSSSWAPTSSWISQLMRSERFDTSKCPDSNRPISSEVSGNVLTIARQAVTGRTTSNVFVKNPQNSSEKVSYVADSDLVHGGHGTIYKVQYKEDNKKRNLAFVNTHKYGSKYNHVYTAWGYDGGNPRLQGPVNHPKAKFLSFNWNKSKDFEGLSYRAGISGGFTAGQWAVEGKNKDAVALIVHEKTNEAYSRTSGKPCIFPKDGWDNNADQDLVNLINRSHFGRTNYNLNKEIAALCMRTVSYKLHHFILLPPKVNGRQITEDQKIAYLDAFLASMPDQTQSSPELKAAEKYLDYVRAFKVYKNNGNDARKIPFELLVDVGTEEDHLTAQKKIWGLLQELK